MLDLDRLLHDLCAVQPDRRPGSPGNRDAVDIVHRALADLGWDVELPQFPVVDWAGSPGTLRVAGRVWPVHPSPYGLGWRGTAPVHIAATEADLRGDHRGAILLLHGEVTGSPLTPKGYPFYGSEHDTRVVAALEDSGAAAIVAVTGTAPELAGAVDPFPLVEDSAFCIPAGDVRRGDAVSLLAAVAGPTRPLATLELPARRWASTARNVLARRGDQSDRVTVVAHIDTKPGTPGALDNAGGVVVLLRVAELLADLPRDAAPGVELLAVNGEDSHQAAGEVDYLARTDLGGVRLAVNIDGAGLRGCPAAFSGYGLPDGFDVSALSDHGLVEGPNWPMSDHMVFAMAGRPAIAITSADLDTALATIAHTAGDRPHVVDTAQLERAARAVAALVRAQR